MVISVGPTVVVPTAVELSRALVTLMVVASMIDSGALTLVVQAPAVVPVISQWRDKVIEASAVTPWPSVLKLLFEVKSMMSVLVPVVDSVMVMTLSSVKAHCLAILFAGHSSAIVVAPLLMPMMDAARVPDWSGKKAKEVVRVPSEEEDEDEDAEEEEED